MVKINTYVIQRRDSLELLKRKPRKPWIFFWHFPLGSTEDFTWVSANGTSSVVSSGGLFFFDADVMEGD
jgi:hypothetical protein